VFLSFKERDRLAQTIFARAPLVSTSMIRELKMTLEDKQVKLIRAESKQELLAHYVEDVKETLKTVKERIDKIWDKNSVPNKELKKVLDEEFGYKDDGKS